MIILVVLFSEIVNCQEIKPLDVKTGRDLVYEWINSYNVNGRLGGQTAKMNFEMLFVSTSAEVFDDYLPANDYDFDNPHIPLSSYINKVSNKNNFYAMEYEISNGKIVSERLDDDKILFEVSFVKKIRFVQKDNYEDDRYEYPYKEFTYDVLLEYDIRNKDIKARYVHNKQKINSFVVLHESKDNTYYSSKGSIIMDKQQKGKLPFVNLSIEKSKFNGEEFDERMVELVGDTLKNYFGIGYGFALNFLNSDLPDNRFSNYKLQSTENSGSFWISYYRQFKLKNHYRLGMETKLVYTKQSSTFTLNYDERYRAMDIDGGRYDRIIDIDNYKEKVDFSVFELPITLRYDYILNDKFSFFAKLGAMLSYNTEQTSKADFDAKYSGYYDWLFDVVIDRNGFYDFGYYNMSQKAEDLGVNNLSLSGLISFGATYYFANKWAVDMGMEYSKMFYREMTSKEDFKLSEDYKSWTSITHKQSTFFNDAINFYIQINYNF